VQFRLSGAFQKVQVDAPAWRANRIYGRESQPLEAVHQLRFHRRRGEPYIWEASRGFQFAASIPFMCGITTPATRNSNSRLRASLTPASPLYTVVVSNPSSSEPWQLSQPLLCRPRLREPAREFASLPEQSWLHFSITGIWNRLLDFHSFANWPKLK
jgi:hypothetical protein